MKMATTGRMVSGSAVPTAAKMLPTTAWEKEKMATKVSMPLVKNSAANK